MLLTQAEQDNLPRWNPGKKGFYEVYYLKWNDPAAAVAGWLRFTLLAPTATGREPEASLWGIFFDAKNPANNRVIKETVSIHETRLENEIFYFSIGASALFQAGSHGEIKSGQDRMAWDLKFEEPVLSLRHLPSLLYHLPYPRTKLLAPQLSFRMSGSFEINGKIYQLNSVPAHQGHLWGTEYAGSWAWGNCNSFREDPDALFEGVTIPNPLGRPANRSATLLFFRYKNRNYSFLSPYDWFHNRSHHETCRWHFEANDGEIRFVGNLLTEPQQMVGVRYDDPSGSHRFCHNTKVADLKLEVFEKKGDWRLMETLHADKSAAFEVVTGRPDPQIKFPL